MRISHEELQRIYDDMSSVAWTELGRLHGRHPLGMKVSGHALPTLLRLELAEPIGRQHLAFRITALGSVVWEQHRPAAHHRRRR